MDAFTHMTKYLLRSDDFKDTHFNGITQKEFDIFLKEYTFEKLKGKTLGRSFAEKFNVQDQVLYILSDDSHALSHIKYCKYIK